MVEYHRDSEEMEGLHIIEQMEQGVINRLAIMEEAEIEELIERGIEMAESSDPKTSILGKVIVVGIHDLAMKSDSMVQDIKEENNGR